MIHTLLWNVTTKVFHTVQCPFLPNTLLLWWALRVFIVTVIQLGKVSPQEQIQSCRHDRWWAKNPTKNGGLTKDINRGRLILTCGIQSVESGHSIAVKHPKMAIVTGEQAGFTGGHNMVAHNITTGGEGENKETSVSTFLEALLKSANSTGGQLLSVRCLFLPRVQQHQRPRDTIEPPLNIIVVPNSASRQYRIRFFQFRSSGEQKRQICCLTDYFD